MEQQPLDVHPFIDGRFVTADSDEAIIVDKYCGLPATRVGSVSREQVTASITALESAWSESTWDAPARYRVLAAASAMLVERRAEFMHAIVIDSGFTLFDAEREVSRAAQTLLACGEEAKRLAGEVVPFPGTANQKGRLGFTVFHPIGIVCAITPFNSPLNTVAHKIGPALGAGNAVILKPASQTPRTADLLVKLLLDCGLPPELISVIYGPGRSLGNWLAEDQRIAFYAFTGSTEVGKQLHRTVGIRRTQLELGSLSSTLICSDANLDKCIPDSVGAAFRKAGQVCTSVQRLYVERAILDEVASRIEAVLNGKVAGDPLVEGTFVGPVISPAEADRIERWTADAVAGGADVVVGGTRDGSVIPPTVLANVAADATVMRDEIFGPVMVLRPFDSLPEAIAEVNDTPYGLAAGIFTADIGRALLAADKLRMGSVHINQTSSSRIDVMPYSGVKESGFGREGPRYAMRDMSEERLITISPPD